MSRKTPAAASNGSSAAAAITPAQMIVALEAERKKIDDAIAAVRALA